MKSRFVAIALSVTLAAACERGGGECPPNAACAAPCTRGRVKTCIEENCPAGQVKVDQCLEGYEGRCECKDPGDDCAGLDCVAGTVCFEGQCLKRQKCGDEVCEPGWSCSFSRQCTQTIASNLSRPVALQIAEDVLYIANRGTVDEHGDPKGDANVSAVAVSGGEVRRLAESSNPVRDLVVDGENVYWLIGTDERQLMSVPRAGGDASMLLSGLHVVDEIALAGGHWYWMDRLPDTETARLMTAPGGGGTPRMLLTRDDVSSGPVIVDGRAHWLEGQRTFVRADLEALSIEELASVDERTLQLHVMASDGTGFYFGWSEDGWTGSAVYAEDEGRIEKLSAASTEGAPVAIVADGDRVYTLIPTANRTYTSLDRAPKSIRSGSEPKYERSHGGSALVTALAVDDVAVYLGVPSLGVENAERSDEWQIVRIRKRW